MTQPSAQPRKRAFDTYETTVTVADIVTPRNIHVRFQLPEGKEMEFKPGQFVQVFVPKEGKKPLRRSYSIASAAQERKSFELCVTQVEGGVASNYIHNLKIKDKVTVMGPLGRFGLPTPLDLDPVFISTGSGIAPFRSMIRQLYHDQTKRKIYLLFGNRYDDDIIYQKEWEVLKKTKENFNLFLTLSRPEKWTGPKGYVGEKIQEFVPDVKDKLYFICGLSKMINDVEAKLLSLGVPKDQIQFEKYD